MTENARAGDVSSPSTVRPPAARLPTSLRGLFDDEGASPQDPFRLPTPQMSALRLSPGSPTSMAPAWQRNDQSPNVLGEPNPEDILTAKQPSFAFPSQNPPRSRSKLSTGNSGFEDEANAQVDRLPLLGIPSNPSSSTVLSDEHKLTPGARDGRSMKDIPSIEIPFPEGETDASWNVHPASAEQSPSSGVAPVPKRQRSQSSISGTVRPGGSFQRESPSTPADYQFPHTPVRRLTTSTTRSPEKSAALSPNNIPNTHQPTNSLDNTSILSPRNRGPTSAIPPSISRTRSANAVTEDSAAQQDSRQENNGQPAIRRPSLSRQASVAVMENLHPPDMPPTAKFISRSLSRDALSDAANSNPIPALKDAYKVRPIYVVQII